MYFFTSLFHIYIFILGLVLGSFLNSWIWRHRENIRIVGGRSMCIFCRRQLKWWENIPLLSFLFLKGRCYTCQKKISWQYPLIEFGMAVSLTFIYFYHSHFIDFNPILFFRDVFFLTFLIIIFSYDFLYKIILPSIVWLGSFVGLFLNIFYLGFSIKNLLLGAVIGGGFFFIQYIVSKGRWIGGGDVRMGVMMGVWLGWQNVLVALFFAYVVGAIFSVVVLILKKKTLVSEIPFGTFLALGTFFAMYWGNDLIKWYLSLIY